MASCWDHQAQPGPGLYLEPVLAAMDQGIVVLGPDGEILRVNRAAEAILGLPEAELARILRPGDRAARLRLTRLDGSPFPTSELPTWKALHGEKPQGIEMRLHRPDGEMVEILAGAAPVLAPDGSVAGAVSTFTDISRHRRAELDLATVSRLYVVLSRVNETIVRVRDEAALYAHVCRIVAQEGGYPLVWVGLLQGRRLAPAASWGPAAAYLDEIRVEVDGELGQGPAGTAVREDRPVVDDDFSLDPGTRPWRAVAFRHGLRAGAAFPLRRGGRPIGAILFYAERPGTFTPRQVTLLDALAADLSFAADALEQERLRAAADQELRRANASLREADRRKDEFLGMLSHELRNPLAPIRNAVRILAQAEPGSGPALEARAILERQAAHMTRLVDDLLDMTRIAWGKSGLCRARVDLTELVARSAQDFQALITDAGIRFQVQLPDQPLWTDADPDRITQVIGNLLHNAGKFTGRGGTVTLALARTADGAEIRVADTGIGLHPDLLPAVFQPFVQGQRSLARSEGGLGLGLALVKSIAELHGGSVEARSPGHGQGAEFTVRLPLAGPPPAPAPAPAGPAAPRRRVLVVDDNRDAADSLALLLRLEGHQAVVAYDGPGALAAAGGDPPDLVLCDLGLPGMDGYQVAREFRARSARCPRLVAVSGYAQPEDVQRALEAGFDAHIAKPPDPAAIARQLDAEPVQG